ncbi:prefoldin subunit beta [Candidatus Woesearchaeota archaeon]|nr:prefoldin subunit beta [Candidatus Woesearchaeota archaeon]MCF7901338.1 prefoldin subunit beta [Candidatus Woesearchaeota archaeon]MCF8014035.1 prefoldin subunit beta [Candidatus Woesearchaeota archaeon]
MTEMNEEINQLSMYEQNSQYIANQRQNFQAQELEIMSALKELEDKEDAYKIIGNIMIKQKSENLKKELKEKEEVIKIKIETLKKQENTMKTKFEELQKKIMENLDKNDKQKKDDK